MRVLLPHIQDLYHSTEIRPVTGRMRRQIFDVLPPAHTVLDLFGGSGILGLEAMARGASHLTYADNDRKACRALRHYIEHSNFKSASIDIICGDVLSVKLKQKYDLIFVDPPYNQGLLLQTLTRIHTSQITDPDTIIVTKSSRYESIEPEYFTLTRKTLYGESCVTLWTPQN